MIVQIKHQYVTCTGEAEGCPLCGEGVTMSVATQYGLHHFYCDRCKVEFTVNEMVADEEGQGMRNLTVSEALDRWGRRHPGSNPKDCPFCGGPIEEWPWGHYLFDSLWCPACEMRFQFQSHPHSKRSMVRTMREFGRRVRVD